MAAIARCNTEPALLPLPTGLLDTGGGGASFVAIDEPRTVLYCLGARSRTLREAALISERRICFVSLFLFFFFRFVAGLGRAEAESGGFAEESPAQHG